MEETKAVNSNGTSKNILKTGLANLYDKAGVLIVLLALVILMSFLSDRFLTTLNIINLVRQISFIALIALGVTCVIITTGIDLSSGSIVGLTSVVVASYAHPNEYSLVVTLFMGLSVGIAAGLINGFLVAKVGLPPFIATLGMFTSARGLAMLYSGGRPVSGIKPEFVFLGAGQVFGIPVPIIILIVVAVAMHIMLNKTRFGRYIYAIGGNEQAAIISGVSVSKVKIAVYALAGFLASLAGVILTARISSGQPGLGVGFELDAIAAAVIGGTSLTGGLGSVMGTLSGALVIGVINNGMDLLGVSMYWQQITRGMIIVLAVFLDMQKRKGKG
ncbi:ABC transporter permease [Dethiobacter alkaliphilus]|uniref:ABC transporter permease n=1 Tax=Dethiobacter alkaliphilus TaxID=427926 RepID=UPI002226E3BA|nr:ribose ABC transporter permease [Dethiobacter alkaliphilus]MCW3489988.1 ribose ABC transporter permease [Dethiobacter alkaliphilus]